MTDLIGRGPAAAPVPETMEGLSAQNRAYRTLCASLEAQMAILTGKGREYQEAVTTLDSERAANAILTDEISALRERVEAAYRAGYADGSEDQARDGFTHKDAVNEGWQNFKSILANNRVMGWDQ